MQRYTSASLADNRHDQQLLLGAYPSPRRAFHRGSSEHLQCYERSTRPSSRGRCARCPAQPCALSLSLLQWSVCEKIAHAAVGFSRTTRGLEEHLESLRWRLVPLAKRSIQPSPVCCDVCTRVRVRISVPRARTRQGRSLEAVRGQIDLGRILIHGGELDDALDLGGEPYGVAPSGCVRCATSSPAPLHLECLERSRLGFHVLILCALYGYVVLLHLAAEVPLGGEVPALAYLERKVVQAPARTNEEHLNLARVQRLAV